MAYFRQIPAATSAAFSYLLADLDRRQAVIIDPAADQLMLYPSLLAELRVSLSHILLTHCHGAGALPADKLAAATRAPLSLAAGPARAEQTHGLVEGDLVACGDEVLHVRLTPGHTRNSCCFLWRDRIFTGDTLLIDDCGASDGSDGDAGLLFDSLAQRLLTLPDETLVYPARQHQGRQVSCIGEQRLRNPRLAGVTRDEFIAAQAQRGRPAANRNPSHAIGEPQHDPS